MRVPRAQEDLEARRVVRADRIAHARPRRQRGAPGADLRRRLEDARLEEGLEHIEIAEDRAERGIDQREALAGEIRPVAERLLDALELARELGALLLERRLVGR